jgi:hypothetical protein
MTSESRIELEATYESPEVTTAPFEIVNDPSWAEDPTRMPPGALSDDPGSETKTPPSSMAR